MSALLPSDNDAETIVHRVGYMVSAVIYGTLGFAAISLAQRKPTKDGNSQASDLSADVMSNSVGRWVVGIAGLSIAVAFAIIPKLGHTADIPPPR